MIYKHLHDYAVSNVWCSPRVDKPWHIKPVRLTNFWGTKGKTKLSWSTVPNPDQESRWHIYMFGYVSTPLLGFASKLNTWKKVSEICTDDSIQINLHLPDGRELPRFQTYMLRHTDGNILLAVKFDDGIPVMDKEELFLSFYNNQYHDKPWRDTSYPDVECYGVKIVDNTQVVDFINYYYDRKDRGGHITIHKNCVQVDDVKVGELESGDLIEMFYDNSVFEELEFDLDALDTFVSEKDSCRKYLLHFPKNTDSVINFKDDISINICQYDGGRWKGVRYHQTLPSAVRMVTHNDVSLPTDRIDAFLDANNFTSRNNIKLQVLIRRDGYNRELVHDVNKIHELYKLSDENILHCMLSPATPIVEWSASNLENSMYTSIMETYDPTFNLSDISKALGYSSLIELLEPTTLLPRDELGLNVFDLPLALQEKSIVMTYKNDGTFNKVYNLTSETDIKEIDQTIDRATAEYGEISSLLDDHYNSKIVPVDNNGYVCAKRDVSVRPEDYVLVHGPWMKAVEGEDYILYEGNVVWQVDYNHWETITRLDTKSLYINKELTWEKDTSRVLKFRLESVVDYNGGTIAKECPFPMDRLRIWLNGNFLYENLDFTIQFPWVYIVSKEHIISDADTQQMFAIYDGIIDADVKPAGQGEYKWIQHGLVSLDGIYDIWDDSTFNMFAGGKLLTPDEYDLAERSNSSSMSVRNGTPYLVEYSKSMLTETGIERVGELKSYSENLNEKISLYLTGKLPEVDIPGVPDIDRWYVVYSPFMSKILYELNTGGINLNGRVTDKLLDTITEPFSDYLASDPCVRGIDERYLFIHPTSAFTTTEVTLNEYEVLERINKRYLSNKVDLTYFLAIRGIA